jgi:hypothetical protein
LKAETRIVSLEEELRVVKRELRDKNMRQQAFENYMCEYELAHPASDFCLELPVDSGDYDELD